YDIALHHGMDKENTIIANMFIPGASLADHVSNLLGDFSAYELQLYRTEIRQNIHNYRLSEAIKYTDWDVITFQQASHDSGLIETYQDIDCLLEWARKH